MTKKNVKKKAKATPKEIATADKISALASDALTSVVKTVRDMTDVLNRSVNLSQEVLLGFKEFANVWINNGTEKTINEIVSEFRYGIYKECLFLTPEEKSIAYSDSKMKKLQTSKEARDKAKWRYLNSCMKEHPDLDEGNHGLPPRRIRDLFYIINQLPKLMKYDDTARVPKGDYSSIDSIPDRLGTIKVDKTAMRQEEKKKTDNDNLSETLATKLGESLIKIQNSFQNFEQIINDCRKVITEDKAQNNVAKIARSVSRRVDNDLVKINEVLAESLLLRSEKELNGSLKLIKERSDIVLDKIEQAESQKQIEETAQAIEAMSGTNNDK